MLIQPNNSQILRLAKSYKIVPWKQMKICKPIEDENIASFKRVVYGMVKTCLVEKGVGLCANQVGINWNMFVMQLVDSNNFIDCFNPNYVGLDEMIGSVEGCLSSEPRNQKYLVKRYNKIMASWQEIKSDGTIEDKVGIVLEGLQAMIFQHEYDHMALIDISMKGEPIKK